MPPTDRPARPSACCASANWCATPWPACSRAARSRTTALAGAVITVPEVRMSPDLKLASAYVMPLGGERAEEIVAALNRHQRFIRGRVAPELDLKFAPEVRFFVDETFEEYGKIDALLRSDRVQRDLRAEDDGSDDDAKG